MSSFLYVENMNFITPAVVSQPLPGGEKATTPEMVGEGIFNAILKLNLLR